MKKVTKSANAKSAPKIDLQKLASKSSPQKKGDKATKSSKDNITANIAKAAKDVKEKAIRETKYIYPADCTDNKAKKDFRRKMRNQYSVLEAKIKRLTKSTKPEDVKELKAVQKEYKTLVGEHYNPEKLEKSLV